MKAGNLSYRIEVQERSLSPDGFGDPLPTWTTIATRWASLEMQGAGKPFSANQVSPDATVRITMRYYDGLTPRHRLKLNSRIFQIEGITHDEWETVIMCKEQV